MSNMNIKSAFEQYFKDDKVKNLKPFQERVISEVSSGISTIAIMPTGGGKSLIYWMSAKLLGGICLVVSPLTALIDEQCARLVDKGFKAYALHHDVPQKQQSEILRGLVKNETKIDFLFVSPERLATDVFFEYCIFERRKDIKLVVVDECHCISQWGEKFRPFYKDIPVFLDNVFGDEWPVILGLTATINPKELEDIQEEFRIKSVQKSDCNLRPEIGIHVEKFLDENEKEDRLWDLLSQNDSKTIIYLYRKRGERSVEDLDEKAKEKKFSSAFFHADLKSKEKEDVIRRFRMGEIKFLFTTNAFGMGMDIPDIRRVIHYMMPESIEQFYQEIGRAGRDDKQVDSFLLYTEKNVSVIQHHYIEKSFPNVNAIKEAFNKITNGKPIFTYYYFDASEEEQKVLNLFLHQGDVMRLVCKSFDKYLEFKNSAISELNRYANLTKTGNL